MPQPSRLLACLFLTLLLVGCGLPLPGSATSPPTGVPPTAESAARSATPTLSVASDVTTSPTAAPTEGGVEAAAATPTVALGSTPAPTTPLVAPADYAALPAWLVTLATSGPQRVGEAATLLVAEGYLETGSDWRRLDLTGDGVSEWVVTAHDPSTPATAYGRSGSVQVITTTPPELAYRQEGEPAFQVPHIVAFDDLTGDEVDDLIYEFTYCGAHTCFQDYHIISWDGGDARLERLSGDPEAVTDGYAMAFSTATFEDRTGDGIRDLVLEGGMIGSVGAGPQRSRTEIWSFEPISRLFALVSSTFGVSDLRYFKLLDANAAFNEQVWDEAIPLYQAVIEDETLTESDYDFSGATGPTERDALRQYAAFRLMLISLIQGDPAAASERLLGLESGYPTAPITVAASALLTAMQSGSDIESACDAVRAALDGIPPEEVTGPLVYMGYANPELTPNTLCPFPASP